MSLLELFQLSLQNIKASKARSLLTMLGIIIGIAAVIVIVGLGNGMQTYMTDSFKSMGTNLLTVNAMGRGTTRSVSVDDMYEFVAENADLLEAVSPTVTVNYSPKIGTDTLDYTSITGVGEHYGAMRRYTLEEGRFIQYADVANRTRVCVVGTYINEEYYQGEALGETIKIGGNTFTIVGILGEIGDSTEGSSDDLVLMPYSTAAKLTGTGNISSFSVSVTSEDRATEAKELVERYLLGVFGNDNAYMVISLTEILDMMNSMINVMVTILAAIAAISLVVGGIGIMNIMLVSVTERTKEIGIRKALGAKRNTILQQFVIEAATTSALGGILGIIFGYILSSVGTTVITMILEEPMSIIPSTNSVLMAFGISAAIGILFGYLPARRAASLNPIDALRYD